MNVAVNPATLPPEPDVWLDHKVWRRGELYYENGGDGRGYLLVRRQGTIPIQTALSFIWVTFMFCLLFAAIVGEISKPSPYKVEYSESERAQPALVDKTFSAQMTLHIVSPEEITKRNASAYALSYTERQPCEIFIPTGQGIWVRPAKKEAGWVNPIEGDVLAHEILHCLRGGWHP